MQIIEIKTLIHKQQHQLGLYFSYNLNLNNIAKSIGCKYSNTHQCWYIQHTPNNLNNIINQYKEIAIIKEAKDVRINATKELKTTIKKPLTHNIDNELLLKLNKFTYWLRNKRYAESTINTYIESLRTFFKFIGNKPLHQVTNDDVIVFNNEYIIANELSVSYQGQVINAIKLFYKTQQEKLLNPDQLIRPKKNHQLPNVLSKHEVKQILGSLLNVKHKTMLSLIYSCGLRRS